MNSMFIPSLLFYYGAFLILCGIVSVALIGWKAKTALVSGSISGVVAITFGHFISQGSHVAQVAGILLCFALFGVFCWRSTKTLFMVFELIPERHPDLKGKTIAFLIISLMAVVSFVVLLLQLSSITKPADGI
jgi:NADH:ubiquinone oxidoreductase subunit K